MYGFSKKKNNNNVKLKKREKSLQEADRNLNKTAWKPGLLLI